MELTYPFYVKATFGTDYYKVNSETEGLKVGKFEIVLESPMIEKIVLWRKFSQPNYVDLVLITKDDFYEVFKLTQYEINKNLNL